MSRIRTGDIEHIQIYAVDGVGVPLTGLTDLYVLIRRNSDGQYYDWDSGQRKFKATGWTQRDKPLTEIDAVLMPGMYEVTGGLDTSQIIGAYETDVYLIRPFQTPGTNAYLPAPGEIRVGSWVNDVITEYQVRQGWVYDIPIGMKGEFLLERYGQRLILPGASLSIVLLVEGSVVFSLSGQLPDSNGIWHISIPAGSFVPTQGSLVTCLATVTKGTDSYAGVDFLSVPEYS